MAQNNFYKDGKVLEYVLKENEHFTNGQLVNIGHYVAVSESIAGPGDLVALAITGIYDLPFKNKSEVTVGQPLYFTVEDGTPKLTTDKETNNVFAGLVQEAQAAGHDTVRVHLKGVAE